MFVCVCVCVCISGSSFWLRIGKAAAFVDASMYVLMHVCVYTNILHVNVCRCRQRTDVYIHSCVYVYICMHVCEYRFRRRTYVYIHAYVCAYIYICTNMCVASVDAPIFIFKRVCAHKYICSLTLGEGGDAFAVMDTHMYITHTPTLSL